MNYPKAFSPDVLAALAKPVERTTRHAELRAGLEPAWYVVETYPQREQDVADELVARGIGIYVPEIEETLVRRGRKIERKTRMFTRYIFVFIWLTDHNYSLVTATEGVFRFVSVEGKPLMVTDREIDIIRAVENGKRPFPQIVLDEIVIPVGKGKKARNRKLKTYVDPLTDIIRVRPWSAFEDGSIATLDTEQRNQTLQKALGLS